MSTRDEDERLALRAYQAAPTWAALRLYAALLRRNGDPQLRAFLVCAERLARLRQLSRNMQPDSVHIPPPRGWHHAHGKVLRAVSAVADRGVRAARALGGTRACLELLRPVIELEVTDQPFDEGPHTRMKSAILLAQAVGIRFRERARVRRNRARGRKDHTYDLVTGTLDHAAEPIP